MARSVTSVRAIFGAAVVPGAAPPHDRVHVRVHYPSTPPRGQALDSGIVPADREGGQLPLVVVAGGVNCPPEGYGWLAHALADRGYAVASYLFTSPTRDGAHGLLPETGFASPTTDGEVTRAVLRAVASLNDGPALDGIVDLDRVALVGHSAGGRTALYLAQDPGLDLQAVVACAAHTALRGSDGRPEFAPVAARCPVMMATGTADGVIDRSRGRYGVDDDEAWDPTERTFAALSPRNGAHVLLRVPGGTHFTFVHPMDDAVGRGFLEGPDEHGTDLRARLVEAIGAFLDVHVRGGDPAAIEDAVRAAQAPATARRGG